MLNVALLVAKKIIIQVAAGDNEEEWKTSREKLNDGLASETQITTKSQQQKMEDVPVCLYWLRGWSP